MTPAMWPEADKTNLTGPEYRCVAAYVDFHGAMWSSRVDKIKVGTLIFDKSMPTPAKLMPPGYASRFS